MSLRRVARPYSGTLFPKGLFMTHDAGLMPLTLAQKDFWEEFQFHSELPVSTVAHCISLKGALNADALARAIQATCDEADVLACGFIRSRAAGFRCNPSILPTGRSFGMSTPAMPPTRLQKRGRGCTRIWNR